MGSRRRSLAGSGYRSYVDNEIEQTFPNPAQTPLICCLAICLIRNQAHHWHTGDQKRADFALCGGPRNERLIGRKSSAYHGPFDVSCHAANFWHTIGPMGEEASSS